MITARRQGELIGSLLGDADQQDSLELTSEISHLGWLDCSCLVLVAGLVGSEAVAVAGDVDDGAAVQEPVEHGGGDIGVAEDVAPGVGASVGGEDDACGCPKWCRGWSGGIFVFVDEAIAAGRSDESRGQRAETACQP